MVRERKRTDGERYHIRAVERALSMLRVFVDCKGELSSTEISRRLELDLSTTFRMLVTLQSQGFVEQDPETGKYHLGVTCLELGSEYLSTNDIRKRALKMMEELRNEFGETVHLTVLEGNEVVYLEKLAGLHPIGLMSSRVGQRTPTHCTGVGKVLLAYLPVDEINKRFRTRHLPRFTEYTITDREALLSELEQVRKFGFAFDNQEHEIGVKCVAVPIFGNKGVEAAMSISGPIERMDQHIATANLVQKMKEAGMTISMQMGGARWVSQRVNGRKAADY